MLFWTHRYGLINGAAGLVLTVLLLIGLATPGEAATPFKLLEGDWCGRGWVTLRNGARERVLCRVKYQLKTKRRLSQSLKCASTSYKIDAQSSLLSTGDRLSGSWRERALNVTGSLSGKASANSLTVSLSGSAFSAGMHVRARKCRQSLNISVTGSDVRKVSVDLRRC